MLVEREPKERLVMARFEFPVGPVIVNSKYALVPVLMAPVLAATPALFPPEATIPAELVYPEEADVPVISVVVPLLFPWITAPTVHPAGVTVGVSVLKFQ